MLAIGAARYVFLAGEWLLPWMRAPLPPRRWRKVVAATQGVVLTVAAAGVLPRALTQALLVAALVAARGVDGRVRVVAVAPPARRRRADRCARASPWRSRSLALLLVWAALVAPHQPSRLNLGAFARLPLELLVVVAVAALLPATPRRVLAVVAGAVLSVLVRREGPRHRLLHGVRPAVQAGRRLELRGDRHRDAARRDRLVERGPRRRRRGRAHRRAPRRPGPGAAARDAGRGRPPRLGAPGGGGARRGLGGPPRRRRAGRLLERRRPGRRRGAGGAQPAWRIARRSPARSPTTASAPRPATGC